MYIDTAHRALDIFRSRFQDSALSYTAVAVIFVGWVDVWWQVELRVKLSPPKFGLKLRLSLAIVIVKI